MAIHSFLLSLLFSILILLLVILISLILVFMLLCLVLILLLLLLALVTPRGWSIGADRFLYLTVCRFELAPTSLLGKVNVKIVNPFVSAHRT